MAVPINKKELQKAIISNYTKLKKELLTIPFEKTSINELEGHSKGTLMNINNLISYLVGWGELVIKWNEKKDNNEAVDFPETGYKWNELGKLAQKFYSDYRNWSFQDLLNEHEKVNNDILSLINSLNNDRLYQINWYNQYTLGRMIQFNTSSPNQNVRKKIRKFEKAHNIK